MAVVMLTKQTKPSRSTARNRFASERRKKKVAMLSKKSKDNKLVLRTQQLYHLAESVEIYVDGVLPMAESGNRTRVALQHQQSKLAPPVEDWAPPSQPNIVPIVAQDTYSVASDDMDLVFDGREVKQSQFHSTVSTESLGDQIYRLIHKGLDPTGMRCTKGQKGEPMGNTCPLTIREDQGQVRINDGISGSDNDDDVDEMGSSEIMYASEEDEDDQSELTEEDNHEYNRGGSMFQPVAGFTGRQPKRWHERHTRGDSPQDFW